MDKEVRLIELPKIKDLRGNLTFLEDDNQIPFKIQRTYWIYDVPGGEERGGHAFKNTNELIIPLAGSFSVEVNRGDSTFVYKLDKTNVALFVPKMSWRKIGRFVSNSICLVVADTLYKDCEYFYDYLEYIKVWRQIDV